MIKKISFENVFGFKSKQIMDFEASSNINFIYGKNSAGKTNILNVITIISDIINGNIYEIQEYLNKSKTRWSETPIITFQVIINEDDIDYYYAIKYDVNEKKILEEELNNITQNINIVSFSLDTIMSDMLNEISLEILENSNIASKGLIYSLSNIKDSGISNIIKLLQSNFNYNNKDLYERLYKDKEKKNDILQQIKDIDVDITDIEIIDNSELIEKLMNENPNLKIPRYSIISMHGNKGYVLGWDEESEGTKKFFNIILPLLFVDKGIMLMDEPANSLHDELFVKFIEYCKKKKNIQFVFATHNQLVLEKKMANKANIYFVEKKNDESDLYSLSDYENIRTDDRHNWKKMYNENRFGGLPNVRD